MFVKSIKIATDAMFPIFRWDQVTSQQAHVSVGGTGFFINSEGYFVSVAHVFEKPTPTTKFLYVGKLPEEILNPALEIKEIFRDDDLDIFVGKIDLKNTTYFNLAHDIP